MGDDRTARALPFIGKQTGQAEYPRLRLIWNLACLAVVLLFLDRMPRYSAQETLFGRFVAYPLLAMIAALLAQDLRRWRRHGAESSAAGLAPHWGLAMGLAYLVLMILLGFAVGTVVFLGLAPVVLGQPWRKLWQFLLVGAATAALFLFLFRMGSGIVLPAGLWKGGA